MISLGDVRYFKTENIYRAGLQTLFILESNQVETGFSMRDLAVTDK